jgi:hypothetical protein
VKEVSWDPLARAGIQEARDLLGQVSPTTDPLTIVYQGKC